MSSLTKLMTAAVFAAALIVSSAATAGSVPCTDYGQCGWGITVDGVYSKWGTFQIDSDGNIVGLNGDPTYTSADGLVTAGISSISGNVDPEIVFGVGGTNNSSAPVSFAFSFSLPITGLTAPIYTESALGVTLTTGGSFPTVGHLYPTSGTGFIVDSQDIRISPFQTVDKGVDIGDALDDPAGGLSTLSNAFKSSSILSGGPFNTMSVIVAFGLADDNQIVGSPGSVGAGLSGRVKQLPIIVPEPAALLLLGASLAALAGFRRRSA